MNQKIKKINIDKNLCLGCASCVAIAPSAFQLGNDGKAELLPSWQKTEDKDLIAAAQSCPTQAITFFREAT